MFNPLLNEQTDEAQYVGNQVEYHKLQYLKVSDSAHIWNPLWRNKKWTELQKQKKVKMTKSLSAVNAAKVFSKNLKMMVWNRKIW